MCFHHRTHLYDKQIREGVTLVDGIGAGDGVLFQEES